MYIMYMKMDYGIEHVGSYIHWHWLTIKRGRINTINHS